MGVTSKLLRFHRVENELRSLRRRIDAAKRYLALQDKALADIDARTAALESQIRQLEAAIHNDENEIASLDERMAHLRETLSAVKTSKEYTALLTELSTFKADKGHIEERVLERMTSLEELREQLEQTSQSRAEREKVRAVAEGEVSRRESDAADRLEELERERALAAADVPADALRIYEAEAARRDGDDVMSPLEEHDRKRMEYACGACQVLMPVEVVSTLVGKGDLTRCVSCGVILYVQDETREAIGGKK